MYKSSLFIEDILSPPSEGLPGNYDITVKYTASQNNDQTVIFFSNVEIFNEDTGDKIFQDSSGHFEIAPGSTITDTFPLQWIVNQVGEYSVNVVATACGGNSDIKTKTVTIGVGNQPL